MKRRTIGSSRTEIAFEANPLERISVTDKSTGRVLCRGGGQSLFVRMADDVSEPIFLDRIRSVQWETNEAIVEASDETGKFNGILRIAGTEKGIRFGLELTAPRPPWMAEWRLSGIAAREIIVPALGGQALSEEMPVGAALAYKYPFWWNAQFVVAAARSGGLWLHMNERGPVFKLLRVKREKEGFALTLGHEQRAPLVGRTLEASWYLDAYPDDWRVPADEHRRWLETAFGLTPLIENRSVPGWLKKINFILELWGMRKDSPVPHHTFDQMLRRIREWSTLHPPERTLLYLPGFAGRGIDSCAPDYRPSRWLGGPARFEALIKEAHRLGYRVMIHTNALAMTFTHPLFPKFARHQVVDVFGRLQGWGLDMDGDWLPEPYFAYINPGSTAWGDLIVDMLGDLIRRYRIDGVFLDQTLLAFNVSKGPEFLTGLRNHIARLRQTFPEVAFAGEGLHEQVAQVLPMAQIHGIDSIKEVHGLDDMAGWRRVHPVSTYLFGRYTRFTAHLLTRHPSHPMFEFQEQSYRDLGVLPALCLYDNDQPMKIPAVKKMIARANEL